MTYQAFLTPKTISFENQSILSEAITIDFDDFPSFRFHIPNTDKIKINVFLSGGMDSGCIAWILMSYGISPTFYTIADKAFRPRVELLKSYLKESFPKISLNHQYIDRSNDVIARDGHSIRGFTTEFVYSKYPSEIFYDGATQLPSKDILVDMGQLLPARPPARYFRAGELTILDCVYGWYSPYQGFDKRISAYLANLFKFDVSKTWTCTEDPQVECMKCFACKEKHWAINNFNNLAIKNINVKQLHI